MNVVFLFLTRSDLNAIPRIPSWLNQQGKIEAVLAFVNPHLAIDPSSDQVSLENHILSVIGKEDSDEERIALEMAMTKRWMQIPREVLIGQLKSLFVQMGNLAEQGLNVLSESFYPDRLSELLTKLRPAWPAQIPMGQFVLVFPNQLPEVNVGRPPGKIEDPEKKKAAQDRMAKAREAKNKKKAEQPVAA